MFKSWEEEASELCSPEFSQKRQGCMNHPRQRGWSTATLAHSSVSLAPAISKDKQCCKAKNKSVLYHVCFTKSVFNLRRRASPPQNVCAFNQFRSQTQLWGELLKERWHMTEKGNSSHQKLERGTVPLTQINWPSQIPLPQDERNRCASGSQPPPH